MPYPLHPAVVHFPIVLAVLMPMILAVALFASRRKPGRAPWGTALAFAVLLPLSAWASVATGKQQEEAVEGTVSERLVGGHEEAAEGLLAGSAILAILALGGLAPGKLGTGARYTSVAAALVVLALAFRVGKSGGDLVYTHGAAAAYVQSGAAGYRLPAPSLRAGDDDDDDDRR